jgi:hypothetical protein
MVEDRAPAAVAVRGPEARAVWATVAGSSVCCDRDTFRLLAWQKLVYGDISPTIRPPPPWCLSN